MNQKERLKLVNKIYDEFQFKTFIFADAPETEFYSYIRTKLNNRGSVHVSLRIFKTPDDWDVFSFLHEIGHVMTNTENMKRCIQEYLATQWAINKCKEYKYKVPQYLIDEYQEYIWKWRERGIKLKGKNIPSKKDLKLIA